MIPSESLNDCSRLSTQRAVAFGEMSVNTQPPRHGLADRFDSLMTRIEGLQESLADVVSPTPPTPGSSNLSAPLVTPVASAPNADVALTPSLKNTPPSSDNVQCTPSSAASLRLRCTPRTKDETPDARSTRLRQEVMKLPVAFSARIQRTDWCHRTEAFARGQQDPRRIISAFSSLSS